MNVAGLKTEIRRRLREAGALGVGFADIKPVDERVIESYNAWLASGKHAEMAYLERYEEVRRDPGLLLVGSKTIISAAFSYRPKDTEGLVLNPGVATYAHIPDYHDFLRSAIKDAGLDELIGEEYKDWRLCIDTAPIFERYWAQKAGVGIIGENGALIVPGAGAEVVLCEILTTRQIPADTPQEGSCLKCGKCHEICPTGALGDDGIDCNRCLSYLTIEHRGEWSAGVHREAMTTGAGRSTIFGCDRCLRVCPMNNPEVTSPMGANEKICTLTAEEASGMTQEAFSQTFKGSPIKRAKLAGLQRNARNCGEAGKHTI